uniref:Ribosomal RNA methyltransferase FtsJ domain-containing protein n=1 Tax=viral metagenome TaxID=1070528 RepID=A0A6C0BLV2_9ZZZZ
MNHLYVPQTVRVKVNLDPVDIGQEYESKIKHKLVQMYGDRCYLNGFINKSSISIVKIENGHREGSHLHGFLTFNVEFSALFCIPKRDVVITCRIKKINKFGLMAESFPVPMDVIVPRQLQAYNDIIDLFKDVYEGEFINVKILNHTMEKDKLVVVGVMTQAGLPKPNLLELREDSLISDDLGQLADVIQIPLSLSAQIPLSNPHLGSNQALNLLKDKITPFNKREGRGPPLWQGTIKKLINPYELIDKYHSPRDLIQYNQFTQIYDPQEKSVYPIITRAYFKLWEVLTDLNLLQQWENQPIHVANLAEGPGGFIQCLIDYRNRQHHSEWKNDTYHAITIKQQSDVETLKDVQDWDNYREGKEYFQLLTQQGYQVVCSYGKTGDGNMLIVDNLQHFTKQIGINKCLLITADGGIYLKEEEYGAQELDNAGLFFAEIVTAIMNQATGGTLVLKMYDMYYDVTIQLIQLLSLYYTQMILIKPKTSRPANSEKYMVCTGFKEIPEEQLAEQTQQLLQRLQTWMDLVKSGQQYVTSLLPFIFKEQSSMIETVAQFNKYNVELQMEKINEGLDLATYEKYRDPQFMEKYRQFQRETGVEWCRTYQLPSSS